MDNLLRSPISNLLLKYGFVPIDDLLADLIACLQDQWQLVIDRFHIEGDIGRLSWSY